MLYIYIFPITKFIPGCSEYLFDNTVNVNVTLSSSYVAVGKQNSAGIAFSRQNLTLKRQILTTKVDPRSVRVNFFILAVYT